jgi:hypothetical protein
MKTFETYESARGNAGWASKCRRSPDCMSDVWFAQWATQDDLLDAGWEQLNGRGDGHNEFTVAAMSHKKVSRARPRKYISAFSGGRSRYQHDNNRRS